MKFDWQYLESLFVEQVIEHSSIQRALLLGLGVGIVPHILEKIAPQNQVTGVEIDAEVIRLGRNHFELDRYVQVEVVTEKTSFGKWPTNWNRGTTLAQSAGAFSFITSTIRGI